MKLYKGSRSSWRKYVPKWKERRLKELLARRSGDLIQDCDGFNHYVTAVVPEYEYFPGGNKHWYVDEILLYIDDGNRVACTCPASKEPASKEEIEEYIRKFYQDEELQDSLIEGGWLQKQARNKILGYLKKHDVANPDGTIKEDFERLQKEALQAVVDDAKREQQPE